MLRERLVKTTDWIDVNETASGRPLSPALQLVKSDAWAPASARTHSAYRLTKRLMDVGLAFVLLVVCAPMLALVAITIRLESRGPAIFRQSRIGRDGQPFRIWKFRTLNVIEDGDNVAQVTKADPRVTRVGRFLRSTSIDELPQLMNVLCGHMSLVGPRPHACAHDHWFASRIQNYPLRRSVKPGITGWAQVNGLRGEITTLEDMRRRVEFDLWYARQASLRLDLRILLATPAVMLRGRNAG